MPVHGEKNKLQKFLKVQKFRKLGLAKIGQHSYAYIHINR